jgi:serine/threonine protein kinase
VPRLVASDGRRGDGFAVQSCRKSVSPRRAGSVHDGVRSAQIGLGRLVRPPEQVEGKADARMDLFAFGCVLYEMLTGRRAFTGETGASVNGGHPSSQPPYVSSLLSEAPPALDRLVEHCLQKDRCARPEFGARRRQRPAEHPGRIQPHRANRSVAGPDSQLDPRSGSATRSRCIASAGSRSEPVSYEFHQQGHARRGGYP